MVMYMTTTNGVAKPSWDDAPEWAQWLAQDANGQWYWYENCPYTSNEMGKFLEPSYGGRIARAKTAPITDWQSTLEQRPHD